jgi:hypothetical protein
VPPACSFLHVKRIFVSISQAGIYTGGNALPEVLFALALLLPN